MPNQFTYCVLGCTSWDKFDDNLDIEITLDDGRRYAATLFTQQNVKTLFEKNRKTGECAGGLYLWASNMILINDLNPETIVTAIRDLVESDEIATACLQIAGSS